MNSSIYGRLAWTNLKKNHKTYLPYVCTSILTVMMFYMMDALCQSPDIKNVSLRLMLEYALGVVLVFSVIFLFYTNSFLIKRRKKELGMYNILGMGKAHIAKMMILETMLVMSVSVGLGLLMGMVFGKLMYLLLQKALQYDTGMHFGISVVAVMQTIGLFSMIFLLILFYNLMQIRLSNPIELLQSKNKGEQEPKTKKVLTLIGTVTIAVGYGIAFVVERPLEALGGFFVAVLCVIIGTYALFTAGSIAVLKILKKNKRYYYQTSHFTAVSGMLYRMKQNAAGLANICILSTMVLVMLSTTISLYMGMEDILTYRFPREVFLYAPLDSETTIQELEQLAQEELEKKNLTMEHVRKYHQASLTVLEEENEFSIEEIRDYTQKNVCNLMVMALEDYQELEQKKITLKEDELLICSPAKPYKQKTLKLAGKTYRVKERLEEMELMEDSWQGTIQGYGIVLPDREQVQTLLAVYNQGRQIPLSYTGYVAFDIKEKTGERDAVESIIQRMEQGDYPGARWGSRIMSEKSFYEIYGSLLFIGIYLGVLFLMATVLIIYYKQISEGYDDRERYQIMKKVGMSKEEVKRSIRNQVLIVFFLPLLTAILHNMVAFRIVNKLLETMNFVNKPLFLGCTVGCIGVFAFFYAVVYAITAREYYKVVNFQ